MLLSEAMRKGISMSGPTCINLFYVENVCYPLEQNISLSYVNDELLISNYSFGLVEIKSVIKACALGAAILGIRGKFSDAEIIKLQSYDDKEKFNFSSDLVHELESRYPQLVTRNLSVPQKRFPPTCNWPLSHNADALESVITHLNDHHAWSREQIADWLESIGE